ncbi:metaxin-1-like [Pollicipes pollicipes]|uniref:metaxin-1-like n=1 Tax=Pollicipes pollicipes TaxID=41117 RepID=UPI0018851EE2|nr:metaxin-1-like [Pollicipes pollicipes]
MKKKNFNLDFELSARQCADSLAFTNLLRDRLDPALWLCVPAAPADRLVRGCAGACFASLSEQLGERDWFLGAAPSSLDARVFGYLAPLLRSPLPSHRLQTLLKAHPNLVSFVTRVQQRLFAEQYAEYERQQRHSGVGRPAPGAAADPAAEHDTEFPNKRRNQLLVGLVAAGAMLAFALANGLVKIENMEPDEYDLGELDAD